MGRSGADYVLLDADEVLAFQAERELVWIVTAKQRLLATQSLRAIEERLGGPQFQRVHRNAIVNVNHVRKMSALSSQRWCITLSNSLQFVVSKRQAHKIRADSAVVSLRPVRSRRFSSPLTADRRPPGEIKLGAGAQRSQYWTL